MLIRLPEQRQLLEYEIKVYILAYSATKLFTQIICRHVLRTSCFNFLKIRSFNYFQGLTIIDLYLLLSTPGHVFVLNGSEKGRGTNTV